MSDPSDPKKLAAENVATRKRGEMRAMDPCKGLHALKTDFQKKYTAQQCDALLSKLDTAIAATLDAAPVRRGKYFQAHANRTPTGGEARWEQAMWEQWQGPRCDSVPGAWYRIVDYQLMLRGTNEDKDWGEIDLLGVTHQGLPVVIELKAPGASDTPASLLVQAAAYALALRKAWVKIGSEWSIEVAQYGFGRSLSPTLPICPLVCAAPTKYWDNWIGQTARAKTVTRDDWTAFMRLVLAFAERGLPASFVRLDNSATDAAGLPRDIRAQVLDPFV